MHRAAFEHEAVKAELLALPGVLGVEDFRSWKMCSHLTIATAHIIVAADRLADTEGHLADIERLLWERHGVRHLTVHFETPDMACRHHHRFLHHHEAEAHGHDHHHEGGHV
jgi:cobalt-zinc-cadmium efflux system protein